MLTDTSLSDPVAASLETDPRIPDSLEIAVAADEGIVTLRGTVESYNQVLGAAKDANDVDGVAEVNNQLIVDPDGADRREDDEICCAALQGLAWDSEVPEAVDVDVTDGWVTLTGDVGYQFQSDAAFDDVASLYGVLGVTNRSPSSTRNRSAGRG
jgi:osmotically-inducible protein OsmY